jgi:hypothetical protein
MMEEGGEKRREEDDVEEKKRAGERGNINRAGGGRECACCLRIPKSTPFCNPSFGRQDKSGVMPLVGKRKVIVREFKAS